MFPTDPITLSTTMWPAPAQAISLSNVTELDYGRIVKFHGGDFFASGTLLDKTRVDLLLDFGAGIQLHVNPRRCVFE